MDGWTVHSSGNVYAVEGSQWLYDDDDDDEDDDSELVEYGRQPPTTRNEMLNERTDGHCVYR